MSRASKGKLRYIKELYKNYVSPNRTLITEMNIGMYRDLFPKLKLKVGEYFRIEARPWSRSALAAMDRYKSTSWRFT